MKIVINDTYGGFGLSYKGVMYYAKLKGIKLYAQVDDIEKKNSKRKDLDFNNCLLIHYSTKSVKNEKELNKFYWSDNDIPRGDPALVKTVKDLGKEANGKYAKLKIVEIPNGVDWEIDEYDGVESIHEKHRVWG